MEDDNIGGSGSFENRQLVDEEGDNTSDYLLLSDEEQNLLQEFDLQAGTNEFLPSLLTNQGRQAGSGAQLCLQQQCQPLSTNYFLLRSLPPSTINQGGPVASGTQPLAQQQLGQPAGPNGCLLEPCINQGQGNQAAAATQSLIAQQRSGQSPVICTGDPHSQRNIVKISAPASLVRKRQYDEKYRENLKKRRQKLVDQNKGLKLKEQQVKTELEASEAENGRLKTKLEASKADNERLKSKLETNFGSKLWDEIESLKSNVACLDQRTQTQYACLDQRTQTQCACLDHRMQTQSTELAELQNKFDKLELKQQNWRRKKKSGMSLTEEFVAQIQENDSVDSAQNIPIISAGKEAELAREEGIDEAHLNWQSQKWKIFVAEGERWESERLGRFIPTDRLTENQTET